MNVYLPNLRLPSAYQEVEYIQSSGTQFINTGVNGKFSTSMNFDYKFTLVQNPPSGQYAILGDKNSSGQGLTMYFDYSSPGILGTWCGSGTTYTTGSVTVGAVTTVNATFNKTQGRTIIINGTTYSNSTIANNVTTNSDTFGIGSDKGATGSSVGYFKIYYFKITKDGTLVRDFIPCYRKSDSVIGLYDLVNNQFYTNSGTGAFSKGNDVTMAELKNAYIGDVYEYSYDFRGKSSTILTNDGWTIVSGTPSFNSYGVAGTVVRLKREIPAQKISNANLIKIDMLGYIGSGDAIGLRLGKTVTSSVREGLTGPYASSSNSTYTMTIYDIVTSYSGMTTGTNRIIGTIDLSNKTFSLEWVGHTTKTGTLTDAQVSSIRSNTTVLFPYIDINSGNGGLTTAYLLIE